MTVVGAMRVLKELRSIREAGSINMSLLTERKRRLEMPVKKFEFRESQSLE